MHHLGHLPESPAIIKTLGGTLQVQFSKGPEGYSDIWLEGPAELVFKGEWP